MAQNYPTKVEQLTEDVLVQIAVTGTKGVGNGRETTGVNRTEPLLNLIKKYSVLQQTAAIDMTHVQKLTDAGKVQEAISYMSEFQASSNLAKSATLSDIIIDAVANFCVKEHGFLEAESDPGSPVFYFSRNDLQPQWLPGAHGTPFCLVSFIAPFG